MAWRGSSAPKDRLLSCLTYLVPLLEVFGLGFFLFNIIPSLELLFFPLFPLMPIYFLGIGGIAVVRWGVFFALYLGVVRNERLVHFLRFNTMQALLLGIFAALCLALLELFGISQTVLLSPFANNITGFLLNIALVVINGIFLVVVGASIYSVVQSVRGFYAEIPVISDAVYSQVR